MQKKILIIINTINFLFFILVISLFFKKQIDINENSSFNKMFTEVSNTHDKILNKEVTLNDVNNESKLKEIEKEIPKKNIKNDVLDKQIDEIISNKNNGLKDIKDKSNAIKEDFEKNIANNVVQKIDMNNHENDKFIYTYTVSEQGKGNNIKLYLKIGKESKKTLKPNTKIWISKINYGDYSKVIVDKKVYLIENKDIIKP